MQMRQLSATLDAKVAQLDKQLHSLHQRQRGLEQQDDATQAQAIDNEIAALNQLRSKLLKSKDLAWRAHQLSSQNDEQQRARQRLVGLTMCGVSILGALVLIYIALQ